jgi:hypothetical protein
VIGLPGRTGAVPGLVRERAAHADIIARLRSRGTA